MIRSIIHRQLGRNMFGIFNFFNKQVSEQQKTYQLYQQQYQNAQNESQRLDIMKTIISLRSEQDHPSLERLENYYQFITDYKRCERNKLKIDIETTEAYQQILQKFLDKPQFSKEQAKELKDFNSQKFDFLKLNQLSFMFDRALQEAEYSQFQEILDEMIVIMQKYESLNTLTTQLMQMIAGFYHTFIFFIVDQHQQGEIQMVELLNYVRQLKKRQLKKWDFISQDQMRELLYNYEIKILNQLMFYSFRINEGAKCIEYQNQFLKLIKDNDGISKYYLDQLQEINSRYGHLNKYRSLQLIEETCLQLEKNEDFFFLQLQRVLVLSSLNQITKSDYEQILRLYDEIKISALGPQNLFYVALLICDIQLKQFKNYQKYIDLLLHPYVIGDGLLEQLRELRYQIKYEINNNRHSNQKVFKDFLSYYENKILPLYKEVKRIFIQKFFELNNNQQRQLYKDMKTIIQDQLHKGIIEDDKKFIKATLEELYKIQLVNPRYRDTLIQMFNDLNKEPTMSAQVIAQLSQYIRLLQQDQKQ